jgi:hypothetical protein
LPENLQQKDTMYAKMSTLMNSGYIHSHEKKNTKTELQSKESGQLDDREIGTLDNRVEPRFAESELPEDEKAKLSQRVRGVVKTDPAATEIKETLVPKDEGTVKLDPPMVEIKEQPEMLAQDNSPTKEKTIDPVSKENNSGDNL